MDGKSCKIGSESSAVRIDYLNALYGSSSSTMTLVLHAGPIVLRALCNLDICARTGKKETEQVHSQCSVRNLCAHT